MVVGRDVHQVGIVNFVFAAVRDSEHWHTRLAVILHFYLRAEGAIYQARDNRLVAQSRYSVLRSPNTLLNGAMDWEVEPNICSRSNVAPTNCKDCRVGA